MIFLKSPKTMSLGHFSPFFVIFAQWGFFPKNLVLSHTTIYGPLTPCWISIKNNKAIPRKLMDRLKGVQKDRRKNGQTLFYRTLPAEAGGPIILSKLFSKNFKVTQRWYFQIFIFYRMIALQKLWQMFFISSKKLFLFSRYSTFRISIFTSFSPYQPFL